MLWPWSAPTTLPGALTASLPMAAKGKTGVYKAIRRFTYALRRACLQDGPGANAIWNITNVTRPDRRYHYLDLAGRKYYAEKSSQDPKVQAGFTEYPINRIGPGRRNIRSGSTGDLASDIHQTYLDQPRHKLDARDDARNSIRTS